MMFDYCSRSMCVYILALCVILVTSFLFYDLMFPEVSTTKNYILIRFTSNIIILSYKS